MNSERLRFWLWAGAALVAGLLLRLWFVVNLPRVYGDSLVYGDLAKTLLQHGIYGFVDSGPTPGSIVLRPTLIRVPGYPLFLATCFRLFGIEHYRAVLNAQIAIDLVTCCLGSALAGRLFGPRARLPVLWLAALCPFTANYTATALAETLVFATIALAFYAFARWQDAGMGYNRWLWIISAALAYSILLRPEQGLLAAAIMPPMLWAALGTRERRSRPLRSALPVVAAAICVILPLVPWTIRNEYYFHVFQPLAPRDANDPGGGPSLAGFGRWYDAWAIDFASVDEIGWPMDGEPIAFDTVPERAFAAGTPAESADLRRRTAALIADYNAGLTLTPEIDARFGAIATELIHTHPVRYYFGLHVARMLDMLLRPRTETLQIADEWWQWSEHPGQTTFAAAYGALNLAYIGVGCAGFLAWRRRGWLSTDSSGPSVYRQLAVAMAASIILRMMLLFFIDNSEPRYTLEFFPVFFVCAGALFATPLGDHADLKKAG